MERRKSGEAEYGFTLIELLIVIIVIGILAAIVVFSLTGVSGQSKTAACTSDAKSVEIAADAYQTKFNTYAPSVAALTPSYLKTVPVTTNGYTISLVGGVVNVTVGASTAPFDDSTGCPSIP
jgi:general secretion pathway protein G